jgi:ATP:ADP antiporter, AAA family
MQRIIANSKDKFTHVFTLFVKFRSEFQFTKFISISLAKLLTIYVFTVLRGLEYSMLVPILGAEMISTVELYGLLPVSFFFMIFYIKLGKLFSRETVVYIMLVSFIILFWVFNQFILPYHDSLVLDLSQYKESWPRLKYPLMMLEHWDICSFYIISEMWGVIMLSLVYWQLANATNTVTEAKKFYVLYGAIGQIGLMFGGWVAMEIGHLYPSTLPNVWQLKVNWLVSSVLIASSALLFLYFFIHSKVLSKVRNRSPSKAKIKISVSDSFKYVFTSKYLGLIALLIICYGVSITLTETIWKNQIKILYPDQTDYNSFMGMYQMYLGMGSATGMMFGVLSLRKLSWFGNSIITPMSFFISGLLFFMFILLRDESATLLELIGTTVTVAAVMTGMVQNVIAKSFKYSIFDASKEIAFIPLDEELKINGKAAVDVIGTRIGRSSGSIIIYGMLTFIPNATIDSLTGLMFTFFMIFIALWFYAVFSLSKEFESIKDS